MNNEFKAEQLIIYLKDENTIVQKPNSHTGNADIERLHLALIEIIITLIFYDVFLIMMASEAILILRKSCEFISRTHILLDSNTLNGQIIQWNV